MGKDLDTRKGTDLSCSLKEPNGQSRIKHKRPQTLSPCSCPLTPAAILRALDFPRHSYSKALRSSHRSTPGRGGTAAPLPGSLGPVQLPLVWVTSAEAASLAAALAKTARGHTVAPAPKPCREDALHAGDLIRKGGRPPMRQCGAEQGVAAAEVWCGGNTSLAATFPYFFRPWQPASGSHPDSEGDSEGKTSAWQGCLATPLVNLCSPTPPPQEHWSMKCMGMRANASRYRVVNSADKLGLDSSLQDGVTLGESLPEGGTLTYPRIASCRVGSQDVLNRWLKTCLHQGRSEVLVQVAAPGARGVEGVSSPFLQLVPIPLPALPCEPQEKLGEAPPCLPPGVFSSALSTFRETWLSPSHLKLTQRG